MPTSGSKVEGSDANALPLSSPIPCRAVSDLSAQTLTLIFHPLSLTSVSSPNSWSIRERQKRKEEEREAQRRDEAKTNAKLYAGTTDLLRRAKLLEKKLKAGVQERKQALQVGGDNGGVVITLLPRSNGLEALDASVSFIWRFSSLLFSSLLFSSLLFHSLL